MTEQVKRQYEGAKREKLKRGKPLVFEKIMRFEEKLRRGESIAIIQFQYNYACNFACEHCSIKGFQGRNDKRSFTLDDVRSLSRQADELGLARFVITGGEPLIFRDFDALVQALDPSKFYINCDTNGWHLDHERARHLKSIGVDRIQLSIDSLDAEAHDRFRNAPGSFQRTLRAIEASQAAELDIFIQTVVTKQRLHSEEFLNFVEHFNGRGLNVFVTYAKPVGAWEGNLEVIVDQDDMAYMRELEKKHNLCTHLTPAYGLDLGCIAVKGMISVTQYGDVLPCPYMHTSIGNVFEEPLKDIIKRGFDIKYFGERVNTCLVAEDKDFILNHIEDKIYGRPLPVPCSEVFTESERTKKKFSESL